MADDDLLLDASDLADIFGVDDAKAGDDLAKSIEDLFLSDDTDDEAAEGAPVATAVAAPPRPPVARPAPPAAAPRAPEPVHASPIDLGEEEPELVEPDRGGMTEEEWRGSAEYTEFKKQVIARHLRKKAAEDLARRAAEERAKLQELEHAEQARQEALAQAHQAEAAAAQAHQAEEAAAKAEAERRRQEALDKYKAAKAATIAQRAQALVQAQDNAEAADGAAEAEKAAKLKGYLAELKTKVAAGGLPPMTAKLVAPQLSAAGRGMAMDVAACKALAAMFEETRVEMLKHVSDAIGRKPAQAMMKKTLAKVAKLHLDVFGRAAVDGKNELRVDGGLDEERLGRALYALPEGQRQERVQKAFFELTEMRFIACELGLGHRQKAVIVSRTLNALETSFARKGHAKGLVDWYFTEAVPSTSLADGDDPAY